MRSKSEINEEVVLVDLAESSSSSRFCGVTVKIR